MTFTLLLSLDGLQGDQEDAARRNSASLLIYNKTLMGLLAVRVFSMCGACVCLLFLIKDTLEG